MRINPLLFVNESGHMPFLQQAYKRDQAILSNQLYFGIKKKNDFGIYTFTEITLLPVYTFVLNACI